MSIHIVAFKMNFLLNFKIKYNEKWFLRNVGNKIYFTEQKVCKISPKTK